MRLPERIETARLRLVPVTVDDAADMRAGRRQDRWHRDYPRPDDVDAASLVHAGDTDHWGPRHVVLGHQAVGSIGCYGLPEDGETEVGFGLVPEARGQGVATEALRGLLAATDAVGVRLRASVVPDNAASLRVLARCGFSELRGSTDAGELVMARPLPRG
ncbi:GNAT family N-acetyltransferase [Nocardioides sp. GXQ0305]|uniref:GNAT family N-acetyltransferase n=1 Tax=Nocardioides sp. GXQ0305 TaxID=3423912 RepID=UPI003D7EE6F0